MICKHFRSVLCLFHVFSDVVMYLSEIIAILLGVNMAKFKLWLKVPQCFFLEYLGNLCHQLCWLVRIFHKLLLHKATNVHPMVQIQVLFVIECSCASTKTFDTDFKWAEMDLPDNVISLKTSFQIAYVFKSHWIFLIVWYRIVF